MNNMYENVVTWNPLGGKCTHSCKYCSTSKFMRYPNFAKKYIGEPYLDEKQLKPLGKGKTIFVCAQNDLFADNVSFVIVEKIINHCMKYPENTYMIQTKNAIRLWKWFSETPIILTDNFMLGITFETNKLDMYNEFTGGNLSIDRIHYFGLLRGVRKYITIEPIMSFVLENMIDYIRHIAPELVYVGANTSKVKLPEPSKEEVLQLISELDKFTTVVIKDNLKRLLV